MWRSGSGPCRVPDVFAGAVITARPSGPMSQSVAPPSSAHTRGLAAMKLPPSLRRLNAVLLSL